MKRAARVLIGLAGIVTVVSGLTVFVTVFVALGEVASISYKNPPIIGNGSNPF